ncbi:MAG: hypothetical protein HYU51_19605 [Candidatus Rokubacteria bacterium]|nr:hypothetical protein [Candidatus Rokubacteria bacterium]
MSVTKAGLEDVVVSPSDFDVDDLACKSMGIPTDQFAPRSEYTGPTRAEYIPLDRR